MIDLTSANAVVVILLLFGTSVVLMLLGLPIAFSLGGLAYTILFLHAGQTGASIVAYRLWGTIDNFVLVCIPLFVFMGVMLEQSGIAGQLFDMLYKWSGGLRGALAAGTVFICMIMAAMTGLSSTATLTMGLTALPRMFQYGYQKSIALGCIGAGGALGILIPPSVTMVIYAMVAQQSVGQLFIGGIIPGVLLGCLFIVYILIRSWLQPEIAPALPVEERVGWSVKLRSLYKVLLPMLIITMVLGSIFFGIATPTEGAAIGALGTIISAAINRSLTRRSLKESSLGAMRVTAMAFWIMAGTFAIQSITFLAGVGPYLAEAFLELPGGRWGALAVTQVIWFILGCLIDPWAIIFITGPLFIPVMSQAGFSLVWFGVVFIVNMEMAYLTPPFGSNLFFLRSVAPRNVTMGDIYNSIWPFVGCQAIALALVIIFPELIMWLPSKMFG